jgi:threonine dehydrogenase-like Zn-dependent dehydrogenase
MTGGIGPDACIDAVGMEAHGTSPDAIYDRVKHALMLTTDRLHVLREAIHCCRKGGTVSVPGVYGGYLDKLPFGGAFAKGLKFTMGQTHVHRYLPTLLEKIQGNGQPGFDPTYIISHRFSLSEAPQAYDLFHNQQNECTKVVLTP